MSGGQTYLLLGVLIAFFLLIGMHVSHLIEESEKKRKGWLIRIGLGLLQIAANVIVILICVYFLENR